MQHPIPDLSPAELRKFGLVTGAIIIVLVGGIVPWLWSADILVWQRFTAPIGGALILWAMAHPGSLNHFYKPWMKFANLLGAINTRIILFILFYGMFMPMGVLMRLVGKDPMHRRMDAALDSYRTTRENPTKDHMEHPF